MSQKTENTFVDRIIDVVIHRRRMVEKSLRCWCSSLL